LILVGVAGQSQPRAVSLSAVSHAEWCRSAEVATTAVLAAVDRLSAAVREHRLRLQVRDNIPY
jgi:hypothetical protein